MPQKSINATLVCILLLSMPVLAAKFWETKEYTAWTDKECTELLRKSPWAQSNGFAAVPAIGASSEQRNPGFGERESTNLFEFRALTAKPIKMALARLQLLQKPNDAALKEQVTRMLNDPTGNEIIIQVSYRTIPSGSSAVHDIHRYFLQSTFADFRTNTMLASDKSGTVPLSRYLAPNQNQVNPAFVFPRMNEKGAPHFTGEEKSITFRSEFTPEVSGNREKYSIFVKLTPKEMKFQNEFAF